MRYLVIAIIGAASIWFGFNFRLGGPGSSLWLSGSAAYLPAAIAGALSRSSSTTSGGSGRSDGFDQAKRPRCYFSGGLPSHRLFGIANRLYHSAIKRERRMADRLFVSVLGHPRSGKTFTWNTMFRGTVRTGKSSRMLELRPGECVEIFLISGSNEERKKYAGSVLRSQRARIVLCSMQYTETVLRTIRYCEHRGFWIYVQWLNPGYRGLDQQYSDYLGIADRLLYTSEATLAVRSGKGNATGRVQELKEFIYGWAKYRNLIVPCS